MELIGKAVFVLTILHTLAKTLDKSLSAEHYPALFFGSELFHRLVNTERLTAEFFCRKLQRHGSFALKGGKTPYAKHC